MRRILFPFFLLLSVAVSAQDIERFVNRQLQTYPKSRLLDIYKSCFQDYMGAEHLVSDSQSVKAYLDEELNSTSLDDLMPWYYEPCGIDSSYYRVSIRAIKEGIITENQLLDAFIRSANGRSSESRQACLDGRVVTDEGEANSETRPSVESWSDRWHMIIGTIDQMKLDLPDFQEDKQFIDSVLSVGKYAISHSPEYREAYHPHYRIVERNIFENELLLQLCEYKPGSDDLEKQAWPADGEVGNRGVETACQNQFTQAANSLTDENNTDNQRQADRLEVLGSATCNKGENGEFQRHHRQYSHSGHPRQQMVHQW